MGAGGCYCGLLQIFLEIVIYCGCAILDAGDFYDGLRNFLCVVRIVLVVVARDGVVVGGFGNWGGVAVDWPLLCDVLKCCTIVAFICA